MAIACLRGLPAFSSLRMLEDTTFCEEPFTSGITAPFDGQKYYDQPFPYFLCAFELP
jgi:hypothetical protein